MGESQNHGRTDAEAARERARDKDLDAIDRASANSFPASDAPASGGPAADDRPPATEGEQTAGVSPLQLQQLLAGLDYPAEKRALLETARQQGADEKAIDVLRDLPQDRFDSADDVSEAVGKLS